MSSIIYDRAILDSYFLGKNDTNHINSQIPVNTRESSMSDRIASICENVSFSFADIIGNDGEKICSLIHAVFDHTVELSRNTEKRIRSLLQDHHKTFSLFTRGIDIACKKAHTGEKVSVDLYIQDIGNPNFINTLREARDNGLDPKLLILEIRSEDYGVMDSTVIHNLRIISDLGFGFSLSDFVLHGNEIKAENLEKAVQVGLFPSYIKIAREVYVKLSQGVLHISTTLQKLFKNIVKKGINILVVELQNTEKINTDITERNVVMPFFQNSTVQKEGIYDIDGTKQAEEGLIRFGNGMNVPQGLEKLKELEMTGDLLHKMLRDSIPDVVNGRSRSINAYIKNLGDDNFQEAVADAIRYIPFSKRKGLIFEILEEKYGSINKHVMENLKFLQKQGFAIAIDDLYVGDNPKGMSKEILEIINEEGIIPDYIKIDGKHIEAIRTGELSQIEIGHLKEIIGHFSLLVRKPIFILEWIQDTEHALQVLDTISMPGATFWFQGRNIKEGNFGLSLKEKVV